jgi:hypothetical protein
MIPVFNDDDAYVGDVVVGISGIITMIGLRDGLNVGFMVDGEGVVTIAGIGGGVDPIVGGCVMKSKKKSNQYNINVISSTEDTMYKYKMKTAIYKICIMYSTHITILYSPRGWDTSYYTSIIIKCPIRYFRYIHRVINSTSSTTHCNTKILFNK